MVTLKAIIVMSVSNQALIVGQVIQTLIDASFGGQLWQPIDLLAFRRGRVSVGSQVTAIGLFTEVNPGVHHPVVGRRWSGERRTGILGSQVVSNPSSALP